MAKTAAVVVVVGVVVKDKLFAACALLAVEQTDESAAVASLCH